MGVGEAMNSRPGKGGDRLAQVSQEYKSILSILIVRIEIIEMLNATSLN
jgi:hypothetical protein